MLSSGVLVEAVQALGLGCRAHCFQEIKLEEAAKANCEV